MWMSKILLRFVPLAICMVHPLSAADTSDPAPAFTLMDHLGEKHTLDQYKGKWVVLEWVNFDCPFVKKHYVSNNMQNLQKTYTDKGVIWLSICSSSKGKQGFLSSDEISSRIESHGAKPTAYLIDADGSVGKLYNAKTTPHMFVISPDGNLVYKGAIDSVPSTSPDDVVGAENYSIVSHACFLAFVIIFV